MGVGDWVSNARKHRTSLLLLTLLLIFGAIALVLDRPKGAAEVWLALPLFAGGIAIATWLAWPRVTGETSARPMPPTLASRMIRWITLDGTLVRAFPVAGALMVIADLYYNYFLAATPALLTEDIIILLTAASLLSYGLVPHRYGKERDFVLIFFIMLSTILVAPLLLARLYLQNFDASVDVYSWVALAPETAAFLSIVGVPAHVVAVPGYTAPGLVFTPPKVGMEVTLVITTACSGIYSFGVFASAFLAFVFSEFEKPSRRLWILLALGVLAAYVANILRMSVIVLVGYYLDSSQTDLQNMLIAHSYAGWIIFLGWTALFWGLLFRVMPIAKPLAASDTEAVRRPSKNDCPLCNQSLTPRVPAVRCQCGTVVHRRCAVTVELCPTCLSSFHLERSDSSTSTNG